MTSLGPCISLTTRMMNRRKQVSLNYDPIAKPKSDDGLEAFSVKLQPESSRRYAPAVVPEAAPRKEVRRLALQTERPTFFQDSPDILLANDGRRRSR